MLPLQFSTFTLSNKAEIPKHTVFFDGPLCSIRMRVDLPQLERQGSLYFHFHHFLLFLYENKVLFQIWFHLEPFHLVFNQLRVPN